MTSLTRGRMGFIGEKLAEDERVAVVEYLSDRSYAADAGEAESYTGFCASTVPYQPDLDRQPHWNGWGADLANRRFQPAAMAGLSAEQVPALELAWAFAYPGETRTVGQPTVVGKRIFVGSHSGRVYSLDAKSGCLYWVFETGDSVRTAITVYDVGEASASGYAAVFSANGGIVYAVDAVSGDEIWQTRVEEHPVTRLTGAPLVYQGRVYVPVSTNEATAAASPDYRCCTNRGSIVALDGKSGAIIWKKYTIAEEPAPRVKNRLGTQLWGPSGAGIWTAPTLDREKQLLYVGTGDNSSDPPTRTSDAIIAMDLAGGEMKWVFQGTRKDAYNISCHIGDGVNCPDSRGPDYDFASSPILVLLPEGRRVLLAAQKSAVVHALDPDANGKLLWQARIGRGGMAGGIMWGPAVDEKNIYVALADFKPEYVTMADGSKNWMVDPEVGGGLFALRIRDGKRLWHTPPVPCRGRSGCSPAQSAAVTVIPGVVFSGAFDGIMRAYSTRDGRVIWEYDTVRDYQTTNQVAGRGGAIDGPGSTVVDGMLYVNSGYGRLSGLPGNVLLAFKPGK